MAENWPKKKLCEIIQQPVGSKEKMVHKEKNVVRGKKVRGGEGMPVNSYLSYLKPSLQSIKYNLRLYGISHSKTIRNLMLLIPLGQVKMPHHWDIDWHWAQGSNNDPNVDGGNQFWFELTQALSSQDFKSPGVNCITVQFFSSSWKNVLWGIPFLLLKL